MDGDSAAPAAPPADTPVDPAEATPDGGKALLEAPLEVKGKRQRKPVEHLVASASPVKPKKELVIEEGSGTLVGDIENVCYYISLKKSDQLIPLHHAMYGIRGKNKDIKKNIRAFSGYPKSLAEEEKAKRIAGLEKRMLAQLKEIASWLDLETSGSKADVIANIVGFLEKPKASGKRHPKELKDQAKARKSKKASKKTKASSKKTPSGKRLTSEPVRARSALMLFAIENRAKVKAESKVGDKAELMQLLKDKFQALSGAERGKWKSKAEADAVRYAREQKQWEAQQEEELLMALEEDEDEAPKPKAAAPRKRKASSPKKAKASAADMEMDVSDDDSDDSDDDEPLIKKVKTKPTKAEIKAAVFSVMADADLATMSKKMVRQDVAAKFPNEDMAKEKEFINECIVEYVAQQA